MAFQVIYALQIPISCGFQEVFFNDRDLALSYASWRNISHPEIIEYDLYSDKSQFDFIDKDLDGDIWV